jgi:hypothetical protein
VLRPSDLCRRHAPADQRSVRPQHRLPALSPGLSLSLKVAPCAHGRGQAGCSSSPEPVVVAKAVKPGHPRLVMLGAWYTYVAQFETLMSQRNTRIERPLSGGHGTARERERSAAVVRSMAASGRPHALRHIQHLYAVTICAQIAMCGTSADLAAGTQSISIGSPPLAGCSREDTVSAPCLAGVQLMQHPELEPSVRVSLYWPDGFRPIAHATSIMQPEYSSQVSQSTSGHIP